MPDEEYLAKLGVDAFLNWNWEDTCHGDVVELVNK